MKIAKLDQMQKNLEKLDEERGALAQRIYNFQMVQKEIGLDDRQNIFLNQLVSEYNIRNLIIQALQQPAETKKEEETGLGEPESPGGDESGSIQE